MKALILIIFFLTASCSTDDGPEPSCYQDENRKIVRTIKDAEGIVLGNQCSTTSVYLIEALDPEQRGPIGKFGTCNLLEEFQVDSTRVVFSGYLYETFETENTCADVFEITDIRLSNQ